MKKIVIKFGMVGMISILLSFSGSANVSLKNGNYFVGFTDVLYSGGFEPKVERVYNSKTQFAGIFGVGWGSEYEVNLSVSADGSVVAHEYGGGAENRFVPVGFTRIQLEKAVDNIISAAKNSGALGGKSQEKSYREKLLKDSIFRNDEWQKFVSQKKLKPVVVSDGTKFTSNRFSFQ